MSKQEIKTLVPKLRFPEFRDAGEWEDKPLGEVLSYKQPTRYLVENAKYSDNYETPVLTAGKTFLLGYTNETKGIFKNNLPTIIFDDFTTAFQFVDFPFKAKSSAMKMLIPASSETNMKFAFEVMKTVKFFPSTHKRYWISEYQNIEVPFPSPAEQQKIADCLSSIDEMITAHTQKHEALKAHKKGLMQQLFPAEGETVPKLRFPAFRDAGEWEERKLGEVASFLKGKGISKADITTDGKQPCIRYGELYTLYNETIENISSHTNITANNLVLSKSNDVIIPASGETQEDIATASCVMESGIALGGDLNIIRTKMNGVFLSYYLNSAKKYFIAQMSQGISVVHLYPSQLKNLGINIPKIIEQQKIANCLSSIDNLITTQAQKIESLKAHKKGLMQQLFPATDEVTA